MNDLWAAIGLMLLLEGALYALFPQGMIEAMRRLPDIPPTVLRIGGMTCMLCGWLIVRWVRS